MLLVETYEDFLKYAPLLDEGDLVDLFDIVKINAKTLSESAKRCGIERKTIYDMMSEGKQVKQKTKERILTAALVADFERSMEVLLSKTMKETRDIYSSYLSVAYQHAMRATEPADFQQTVTKFESTLQRILAITDLERETATLSKEFVGKAAQLGLEYNLPVPRIMDTDTVALTLPALIRDLAKSPVADVSGLAKKWHLPPTMVTSMSNAVNNMPMLIIRHHDAPAQSENTNDIDKTYLLTTTIASKSNPETCQRLGNDFAVLPPTLYLNT
jgi:hypothetical protein